MQLKQYENIMMESEDELRRQFSF